jgi:hypothetical protein
MGVIFCYTFESERCPRARPIPILEGMRNFPESLAENAYDVTGGFEVRASNGLKQYYCLQGRKHDSANLPKTAFMRHKCRPK